MKNFEFLKKGRKIIFSLALFLLVFAAASVVKVQALGNVTGQLWGGSEDSSIGGVVGSGIPDGNETGVGWISMSGTNYGVTMPLGDGSVTGYAWASASDFPNDNTNEPDDEKNGLGWIQFDPSGPYPATDCNGTCPNFSTRRNGNMLEGWARFVSIRDAFNASPSNSGGWLGWIKMSGIAQNGEAYGVDIRKMKGSARTPSDATYAWSNELGGIDFSRASLPENTITLEPASFDLREFSLPSQPLYVTVRNAVGDPVSGKTVTLNNPNPGRFSLVPSCMTNSSGECPVSNVTASDFTSSALTTIVATCASCAPDSSYGEIIKTPNCNISCPDSFTVPPDGNWHNYSCGVSSPTGDVCNVDSCTPLSGGSSKISVQKGAGNTCDVKADSTARYDTAVSRARAGTKYDDTNINVQPRGWIETNP